MSLPKIVSFALFAGGAMARVASQGPNPSSSTTGEACHPTCINSIDACGQTYGPGCFTACAGVSTTLPYTTTYCDTKTILPVSTHTVQNTVEPSGDDGYHGTPTFTTAAAPHTTHLPKHTTETNAPCHETCINFTDACSQTYGPGCFTACPGVSTTVPFTTTYCDPTATLLPTAPAYPTQSA